MYYLCFLLQVKAAINICTVEVQHINIHTHSEQDTTVVDDCMANNDNNNINNYYDF